MQDINREQIDHVIFATLSDRWKGVLIQGLVLIGLGLLAIALPGLSTLAIEIVIGATLIVSGAYRVVATVVAGSYRGSWLSLLGGGVALAFGCALFVNPSAGAITLTSLLGVLFLVQGVLSLLMAAHWRRHLSRWLWIGASGLIDLLLAFLILSGLPGAAGWVLGLMLGINLSLLGAALTGVALEIRPR